MCIGIEYKKEIKVKKNDLFMQLTYIEYIVCVDNGRYYR